MADRRTAGRLAVALGVAVACVAAAAAAEPERGLHLYSYDTEFLKVVYYSKDHEYLVPHLVRCFENSLRFHRQLFDYTPSEKIVVLLHDFGDYGHGGTSTVPWNFISIGIEPFDYVYETMPANERLNWLMHHELVHVVATDKAAGPDLRWRSLFTGKVAPTTENPLSMFYSYLTSPRWYSPRWYHEGIAVFLETWMAGGLGRVLGGYDEMVFRTMALEDRHFYDIVGLESEGTTIDFQVGQNSYLYGTRFVVYLALEHGPEKVLRWFSRTPDSRRYFSAQFREVYGVELADEWARWIQWELRWQQRNLERIRIYPVTRDRAVARALGSASRPYFDAARNRVIAAVNYPGTTAHIAAIDLQRGTLSRLGDVSSPALYFVTSLAYDAAGDALFYTTDNSNGWRDLHRLDLASGDHRLLLKDCRAGDLVVNPTDRTLWAVQHHNGLSSIIEIPPPYEGWRTLVTLPYGKDVFDLDISPDGKTVSAALIEVDGHQRLVTMQTAKLLAGDASYEVLHDFGVNSPANFVFSADGRSLYGSSYQTGVSNLFRWDFAARRMDALTNAESGYFRPLPLPDGRVFAFRYSAEGFVPALLDTGVVEDVNAIDYLGQQVVERHPVVTGWNAGSPARVDLDSVTLRHGDYSAWREFRLGSLYPVLEGYKDSVAAGVRFEGADPAGLHTMHLTAAYSPDEDLATTERIHASFGYSHWPWTVRAAHNGTDFYDLFGPTKTSRKGDALSVSYENYLINEPPRTLQYSLGAAGYWNLERLPQYQNVATNIGEFQAVSAGLGYQRVRRTIGGVEPEKGLGWRLVGNGTHVGADLFTRMRGDIDIGIPLPLDHSSLWLRGSAGSTVGGDESSPFAKFYFGGFGNNWVDDQSVRRYREHYSFPGLELNDLEANQYGKLVLEWTLPPVRFRRAGSPGLYLNWLHFALFAGGIAAESEGLPGRREVGDAGVQADLKLVMFSSLESTLSLGYARAFEDGRRPGGEWMVSLKLLR
ncbi:MAG: PD40 domain-containing protein [Acidobacteria bacterium]|nr:PD40 domain-containing protein [Acidobacteriota bacterium]